MFYRNLPKFGGKVKVGNKVQFGNKVTNWCNVVMCNVTNRKKNEIWLNILHQRKRRKSKVTTEIANKMFDYTTSYSHPTGVINGFTFLTFDIPATAV